MSLIYALVSVIFVSFLSLVGVFLISWDERKLDRALFVLISFAAGAIIGTAFFDLLPEAFELGGSSVFLYTAFGFVAFFFLERSIYWYHGHGHECEGELKVPECVGVVKNYVYLNLIGDVFHNLIDGMVITTTFFIDIPLGITTTLAVIFHELPQEIGDFAILIYGGFTKRKALIFNFLSALTALLGVFAAYLFVDYVNAFSGALLGAATGGFIYISAGELLPELQKENIPRKAVVQYSMFILGLLLILVF